MIEALPGLSDLNVKHRVLRSALDILGKSSQNDTQLKLGCSSEIYDLVSDLWNDENYQKVAQGFVKHFTDRE
jgi:hypothetical protein